MTRLPNPLPEALHALESPNLLSLLSTHETNGLTDDDVLARVKHYGRNKLPDPDSRSPWAMFFSQFKSTIVLILSIAAIISVIYNHFLDAYIVGFIIITNAIVGFLQEFKAERTIEALKQLVVQQASAIRNGKTLKLSAHELVPGDIILLDEGDQVPADARLLSVNNLQTSESALTGESLPIDKDPSPLPADTSLSERLNMVYMGTSITRGHGIAVVTAIGTGTTLGTIATNLQEIEETTDHFKVKTNELGRQMAAIGIASTALIFIVGYFFRNFTFDEIFMFSVASMVSAIPEGLPVILTIVLALSAKRMANRNAIVRRLSATETLSIVDTIVTDKTGTLTQNLMTATTLHLPYQSDITIDFHQPDKPVFLQEKHPPTKEHYPLQKLLDIAGMCHNVRREFDAEGQETFSGDPTEIALVTMADKSITTPSYHRRTMQQLEDLPFHQDFRWRASLVQYSESQGPQVFVIGSPETVLAKCTRILMPDHKPHAFTPEHQDHLNHQLTRLSKKGLRVLATAYKPSRSTTQFDHDHVEEMIFAGFVGMIDPPRPEVKQAIATAHKAGIAVIMATGDHPVTAAAIGQDLGLITAAKPETQVMTASEFEQLSDEELSKKLDTIRVYARMTPVNKLRLAQLLQDQGKVIAMTGDGVNDAPALKKADIGIGMGKNGTDVAREASDIILADDNFATIINAVEEGRTQLRNIRRTSFFLITINLAQTLGLVLFLIIGFPLPLLPKQILWLNLITGGVTDMALATEPVHDDVLSTPPKNSKEPIINRQIIPFLVIVTTIIIILSLGTFIVYLPQGLLTARTATFTMLSITQILNILNLRSLKKSIFSIGIFTNRNINLAIPASILLLLVAIYLEPVRNILELAILQPLDILLISLMATSVIWASEIYKWRRSPPRPLPTSQ
jgi:P-type Ca2+ transporter type 2C